MIIASIAMEELSLSHILNAEGEKLQYILGTLPGTKPCAGPQEVLAVNKSVTALVEAVTQNQMLLKSKLEQVLEFCPPPPVCPAPCPPPCQPGGCPPAGPPQRPVILCEKSALQLAGQRDGMLWSPGCRLPWRQRSRLGKKIRWDERIPAQLLLDPGKAYTVQYTLNVCAASPAKGLGTILLRQSPCGSFTEPLPLHLSMEPLTHGAQTLQYAAVLYPRVSGGLEVGLSLVLESKDPLYVERAVIDVIEL